MKYLSIVFALTVALLAGCANPPTISNQGPGAAIAQAVAPPGGLIATGMEDAAYNFDQAVSIGVLPANDPAPACAHGALQLAGLEAMPGATTTQSFTPKVSDVISAQSVLYIQAAQLRGAKPLEVSTGCKVLMFDLFINGIRDGARAAAPVLRLLK